MHCRPTYWSILPNQTTSFETGPIAGATSPVVRRRCLEYTSSGFGNALNETKEGSTVEVEPEALGEEGATTGIGSTTESLRHLVWRYCLKYTQRGLEGTTAATTGARRLGANFGAKAKEGPTTTGASTWRVEATAETNEEARTTVI